MHISSKTCKPPFSIDVKGGKSWKGTERRSMKSMESYATCQEMFGVLTSMTKGEIVGYVFIDVKLGTRWHNRCNR